MMESDADAGQPKNSVARARGVPQPGSQRATPCSRCVRLRRDCYEQVNGKKACYYCGKSKVCCETDGGQAAGPKKGKGPARKKAKKVPSAPGDEAVEPSARRFTREEKGKSKGASLIIMIYIKPLIHILPAAFVDVEMADIHLNATGIPDANANADANADADPCADVTMITAVDHSMDEEAQWEEDPVPKPSSSSQISDIWEALASLSSRIGDVNEIWETLTSLSSRISDIEAYLGLQRGEQPIALYNGFAAGVINVRGSPTWTRDMRMAKWTEAEEDLADEDRAEAPAVADENHPAADEDNPTAEANLTRIQAHCA